MGAVIGVSIKPGATALTRIPLSAHLTARFLVTQMTPAFAAPYPGTSGTARSADIDAKLATLAPPAAVDAFKARYSPTVNRYGPVRFSATDASNPSGFDSSRPPGKFAPALLNSTSSWVKLRARASTESGSVICNW